MHAGVIERGLGNVPVSMHSPQSKVNTAALFSSQPSAGSPQARARETTHPDHTHTHTHTHCPDLFADPSTYSHTQRPHNTGLGLLHAS